MAVDGFGSVLFPFPFRPGGCHAVIAGPPESVREVREALRCGTCSRALFLGAEGRGVLAATRQRPEFEGRCFAVPGETSRFATRGRAAASVGW